MGDLADQTFLHDVGDQAAVVGEHSSDGEPSGTRRSRCVLVVQQPFVRSEAPVEPHGVVEARQLNISGFEAGPVREQGRVEQGCVGRIGQQAGVQDLIVGEVPVGSEPDLLHRWEGFGALVGAGGDVADVDGKPDACERVGYALCLIALGSCGQRVRWGDIGHGVEEFEPVFRNLKRCLQVEDGLSVLDGDHPAGSEASAVSDAVDFVQHRHGRVSRSQEVCVQRVHASVRLDGSCRRDQRLPGYLPAEDTLAVVVRRHAPKDIDFDHFEVEKLH